MLLFISIDVCPRRGRCSTKIGKLIRPTKPGERFLSSTTIFPRDIQQSSPNFVVLCYRIFFLNRRTFFPGNQGVFTTFSIPFQRIGNLCNVFCSAAKGLPRPGYTRTRFEAPVQWKRNGTIQLGRPATSPPGLDVSALRFLHKIPFILCLGRGVLSDETSERRDGLVAREKPIFRKIPDSHARFIRKKDCSKNFISLLQKLREKNIFPDKLLSQGPFCG